MICSLAVFCAQLRVCDFSYKKGWSMTVACATVVLCNRLIRILLVLFQI